jgi:hypothetical protein
MKMIERLVSWTVNLLNNETMEQWNSGTVIFLKDSICIDLKNLYCKRISFIAGMPKSTCASFCFLQFFNLDPFGFFMAGDNHLSDPFPILNNN